jgi:hypothetical protein
MFILQAAHESTQTSEQILGWKVPQLEKAEVATSHCVFDEL